MDIERLFEEVKNSYDAGKPAEAIEYLITILEIDTTNKNALVLLSNINFEYGYHKDAVYYMEYAYQLYDEDVDIIYILAYFYTRMNKNRKALKLYERILEIEERYDAYINIALCCKDLNYRKKAIANAMKAYEMEPLVIASFLCLAECYHKLGETEKAIEVLQKALVKRDEIRDFDETAVYYFLAQMCDATSESEVEKIKNLC